jgi:hypothetical protein
VAAPGGELFLVALGNMLYSPGLPCYSVVAVAGYSGQEFKWRTMVYLPYFLASNRWDCQVATNGNLWVGAEGTIAVPNSAVATPSYSVLELTPQGNLAGAPAWANEPTYGGIALLPQGGYCLSRDFGKQLLFYGPTGQLLARFPSGQ